jgi:hypothetical protein
MRLEIDKNNIEISKVKRTDLVYYHAAALSLSLKKPLMIEYDIENPVLVYTDYKLEKSLEDVILDERFFSLTNSIHIEKYVIRLVYTYKYENALFVDYLIYNEFLT